MQTRLDNLLDKYNLSALKQPVTWGADELVAMGLFWFLCGRKKDRDNFPET
jgi:hypothetical protein